MGDEMNTANVTVDLVDVFGERIFDSVELDFKNNRRE